MKTEKQKRKKEMKSSELLSLTDLSGWRISEGYFIELKHGLMGTFPALIAEKGKDLVCLSEDAVKKAISLLPKRPYTTGKYLFLVNEKGRIAFMLADVETKWRDNYNQRDFEPKHRIHYDSPSLVILTEEDLDKMKAGSLKWAPGLIGSGMSGEELKETVELAAKQGPP